jgi:hypothetical protein
LGKTCHLLLENVRSPAARLAEVVTSTFRGTATPGLVEMVAAEARRGVTGLDGVVTDPDAAGVEPVLEPELAGGAPPGVNAGQASASGTLVPGQGLSWPIGTPSGVHPMPLARCSSAKKSLTRGTFSGKVESGKIHSVTG